MHLNICIFLFFPLVVESNGNNRLLDDDLAETVARQSFPLSEFGFGQETAVPGARMDACLPLSVQRDRCPVKTNRPNAVHHLACHYRESHRETETAS